MTATTHSRTNSRSAPGFTKAARGGAFGLALGLWGLLITGGAAGLGGCRVSGPEEPPDLTDLARPADQQMVACTAQNCRGCCKDGVCETGNTATTCGTGGGACVRCTGAQVCRAADAICAADPAGRWLLAATQAEISINNPQTGKPWHTDGSAPKAYVAFDTKVLPGVVAQMTGTPAVWGVTWASGFEYLTRDLMNPGIELQVRDQVGATPAATDPILSNKHRTTISDTDFERRRLDFTGWEGVTKITFVLQER